MSTREWLSMRCLPGLEILAIVGLFVLLAGLALINDGSRYATQVNLMVFLPAVLLIVISKAWVAVTGRPAFWVLCLLLGWVFVCAWLNGTGSDVAYWFKRCLQILVFVLLVSFLSERSRWFEWGLIAAVGSAMFCAWLSLIHTYWFLGYPWAYREYRLESSGIAGFADFGNAIVAALYYGAMAVLALGLAYKIPMKFRVVWYFGALGLCVAVFMTYSRGVWVALAIGAFSYWALSLPNRLFSLLLGATGAGTLLSVIISPDAMAKVFLNLTHREEIWQYAVKSVEERWLVGLGPEAAFSACIDQLNHCFNQAHSLYLQTVFEFGMLGLLLLLALPITLLKGVWPVSTDPKVRLALPLLAFALVAGVASYHTVLSRPGLVWIYFWLPIGILLGVNRRRAAEGKRV